MKTRKMFNRLKKDKSALSSVITIGGIIAVIMGLVVAPLLLIYIPKWTKEAEAEHMDEISDSFSNIRGNINKMIENDKINGVSNVRLDLGTQANSLFLPDSRGTLTLKPDSHEIIVYNANNSIDVYSRSVGSIEYSSNNYEYTDQTYIYENGGVILDQDTGSTMELLPGININRHTRYFIGRL